MKKNILKVVLFPIVLFCILIHLCSNLAALACGWLFRIFGVLILAVSLYCKAVNWTADQEYMTTLLTSGILCIAFPSILGVLDGLAEGIRETVRLLTE